MNSRKCASGRQQLIQNTPKGPDICWTINRITPYLLRAHVRWSAKNDPRSGHRRDCGRVRWFASGPFSAKRLRQSKVQHLYAAVRQSLEVGRLEIAMRDSLLVRCSER